MNTRTRKPDLERDLIDCKTIKDKVRENDGYSRRLYAALCNTRWLHDSVVHSNKQDVNYWSCSWRHAGSIVSTLKASGGDYSIDIEVKDSSGLKTVVAAQITLLSPPTVEAIEPIVVKVGDNVGFTISATDPEGGELRYKALNTPAGFKRKVRNGYNGVFLWYTTKASEGDYSIDIEVKNAEGLKTVVVAQIKLESMTTVTLLTASSVVGPYAPETAAVIDENAQTITVAKAGGIRFYKLQSGDDAKLKITSFAIQGDNVVMSYQPAGD